MTGSIKLRRRDAFKTKLGQDQKPQSLNKLRVQSHAAQLDPVFRRILSRAPDDRFLLEARAFPEQIVNGTILERIIAKQVHDRGYRFQFQQFVPGTPFANSPRMDVAVYGTGISEPLDLEAQGQFWHTDHAADDLRKAQIELAGIRVVYLWEADLIGSEDRMQYALDLALRGVSLPEPTNTFSQGATQVFAKR